MLRHAISILTLLTAVSGVWLSKSRLDALHPPRNRFEEMLYVPRGVALRLVACGFDAPLADFLWLQCLIYYSDNWRAKFIRHDPAARYRYLYDLYQTIVSLNPRFMRAYLYGGLFLASTGLEDNLYKAIDLLRQGVAEHEKWEAAGAPLQPDERWRLHMYLASIYDMQLQTLHAAADRPEDARRDAMMARSHYRQAVASPGCPPIMLDAWRGFEEQARIGGGVVERYDALIGMWQSLLEERSLNREFAEEARTELERLLDRRRRVMAAQEIEQQLSALVMRFHQKTGRLPRDDAELMAEESLPAWPLSPLDRANDMGNQPDRFLLLPDGRVRSLVLARLEAVLIVYRLREAIAEFALRHANRYPARLEMLVQEGLLSVLPQHPLAILGFRFAYDPCRGWVEERAPQESICHES